MPPERREEGRDVAPGRSLPDEKKERRVDQAEAYVKDKAPDVAEFVTDNAKKVVSQVAPKKKPAAKRSSSTASDS